MNFDLTKVKWKKGSYGLPEALYQIKTPGVTTIINEFVPDPELDAFIASVGPAKAEQIMTAAGHRGSSMHMFIENYVSNLIISKDTALALKFTQEESPKLLLTEGVPEKKISEGLDFFYKFYYSEFSNIYDDIVGTEMGVYSPTLFYRGKIDMFYKHRVWDFSVADFKSMSTPIKEGTAKHYKMKLQLGAYGNALDEMYQSKGLVIKYASLICINKQDVVVQEIACSGAELQKMKAEFRNLAKEWHIKYKQEYLIKGL
jgi:hypothetical protein